MTDNIVRLNVLYLLLIPFAAYLVFMEIYRYKFLSAHIHIMQRKDYFEGFCSQAYAFIFFTPNKFLSFFKIYFGLIFQF